MNWLTKYTTKEIQMKTRNKKVNEMITKRFKPLDRVELVLGAFLKQGHMSSGHMTKGNNGFYYAGDDRYISYGKKGNYFEKSAFMKQISGDSYAFSVEDSNRNFKIFSFMNVRKNYEHKITQALISKPEHAHRYWERWCIFKDGTILRPELTEKLIKKIEIQSDHKLREENEYLDELLSVLNSGERNTNIEPNSTPAVYIDDEMPF